MRGGPKLRRRQVRRTDPSLRELDPHVGHVHGGLETVGKLSLGLIRDFRVATHAKIGLGGLYSFNFIPAGLEHAYGNSPHGAMGFVRLVID